MIKFDSNLPLKVSVSIRKSICYYNNKGIEQQNFSGLFYLAGNGKIKYGAFSFLAFHPNFPTKHFHMSFRNG